MQVRLQWLTLQADAKHLGSEMADESKVMRDITMNSRIVGKPETDTALE
jgi:hypothetical protein